MSLCVSFFTACNPSGKMKHFPGRSLKERQGRGELDWLLQQPAVENNTDCQWHVEAQKEGFKSKEKALSMQTGKYSRE